MSRTRSKRAGARHAGLTRLRVGWRQLTPFTRGLCVFFLFNCVVLNVLLAVLPWTPRHLTALHYTGGFILGQAAADSWEPMRLALDQFRAAPGKPLYSQLFFERHVKFIYPPTSLLLTRGLDRLLGAGSDHRRFLNGVSWIMVLAMAGVVAAVFWQSRRDNQREAVPLSPLDAMACSILAVAFTLTFYPVVKSFRLGQMQTWLNLLFAMTLWSWLRSREAAAGVLAGMICLVKPQHGVLLLWGISRRRWRFVLALAAVLLVAGTMSIAVFGLANCGDYVAVLSFLGQHGESFYPNQSVNGLLHRLLFNGDALEWHPDVYPPFNLWVYSGTLASSAVFIALCLFWRRGEHDRASTTDLMIGLLTCTIASPLAWEHYYGVLLPIYAISLPALVRRPVYGTATLPMLGATYVLASNYFGIAQQSAGTAFNLLQSYLLLAALAVLVSLYALRRAEAVAGAAGAAGALASARESSWQDRGTGGGTG